MTTTQALTVAKIEDHGGEGVCRECSREGLRWVATLSDGTHVGLECAKKVMGWKPSPKSYAWIGDFRIVAEHDDGLDFEGNPSIHIMWKHRTGSETRETVNGSLRMVNGVVSEWRRRGWAA